jgi:hypothetical protein
MFFTRKIFTTRFAVCAKNVTRIFSLNLACFSSSNTKSQDFIVVPRNLLVKLNALEKQTDENYFENLKKSQMGTKEKARTISPSTVSLEDFSKRVWKRSLNASMRVEELMTFNRQTAKILLQHACARCVTNIFTCFGGEHAFLLQYKNFSNFKRQHMALSCDKPEEFEFYGVTRICKREFCTSRKKNDATLFKLAIH